MRKLIFFVLLLFFISCNNAGENKSDKLPGSADHGVSSDPKPNSSGEITASEITVTLTGGANAGTYTATSNTPTCSMGLTGKNSFGNQYSVQGKADNEFSSLQLIIDNMDAAKNGTGEFSISISFGKLLQGKSYEINGRSTGQPKSGKGKASLMESGGTKTVVIEGKTAEGIGISATIKCNSIITAG